VTAWPILMESFRIQNIYFKARSGTISLSRRYHLSS